MTSGKNEKRNYLPEYRKMVQATQKQLADAAGCTRETIARIESGQHSPSLRLAYRLTAHLNIMNEQRTKIAYEVTDIFPIETNI